MRASVKSILCALLFFLALATPLLADDVITNIMSPIVSYQYPDDFSSQALTNGGISSPIVSYQYFEWPGDDVLHLSSSRQVSYFYQFLDAPLLTVLSTSRLATTYETTPQTSISPPPSPLQLETFLAGAFTTNPPFPPDLNKMTVVLTHGWLSKPDEWATNMAALMVSELGASSPNIFAWNWTNAAQSSICDPGTPENKTPEEGRVLGQALLAKLGPNYSQSIHFVGHSLGTLVNASAANYLHETSQCVGIVAALRPGLQSAIHHKSCGHKFLDDAYECSGNRGFSKRRYQSDFWRSKVLSVEEGLVVRQKLRKVGMIY